MATSSDAADGGEFERHFADETFFSLTFGRHKVHGHEDGGSLTYSAGSVNWVVDPGKYSYSHETAIRKHMVAHDSHSLTYLVGRTRSRKTPVELLRHVLTDEVYDFTLVDRGYAGVEITRRVVYSISGEYVVVMDTVKAPSEVTAVQRWQLGPGVDVEDRGMMFDLSSSSARAQLRFFGLRPEVSVIRHDGKSPEGLVATGWKQSAEAAVIEARRTSHSLRFITVIAPNHGRGDVTINAVKGVPQGTVVLEVDTGRAREMISLTATGARVLPSGLSLATLAGNGPVPGTDSRRHLDPDVRAEVFRLVAAARAEAWDVGPQEARRRWGAELEGARAQLGSVDLGLAACQMDLKTGPVEQQRALGPTRSSLLNWGNVDKWTPSRYKFPVVSHRGRLNRELVTPDVNIHTLDLGELVLPGVYIPGDEPVLTVLFQGALDRTKTTLPVFQRFTGQTALGVGHSLILSDPTLDLARNLRLGWYMGTESLDLHEAIAGWVEQWCALLDIEHVVLTGSSGGGFAALHVGAFLPDSLVIPLSPQTDTRAYLSTTQRQLYEAVFGVRDAPTGVAARLSVAERIRILGQSPRILYVQNVGDQMHRIRHADPFRAELATQGLEGQLEYRPVDLGPGHNALNARDYQALMTEVYGRMGFSARPLQSA